MVLGVIENAEVADQFQKIAVGSWSISSRSASNVGSRRSKVMQMKPRMHGPGVDVELDPNIGGS
jgi:hypothetical protein